MDGGLCRYSVTSSEPTDEGEEDIVQTARVPARVVHTSKCFRWVRSRPRILPFPVHQFGLFEFKTGRSSLPSTPTARSKVAIFGLDAISRNLFNGRPSSVGDFFSGSISGARRNRSRSTTSRSSMYTQTTTTMDSLKSSSRSATTAATTISTMDDDFNYFASRSSKGAKLSRQLSAGESDSDRGSPRRSGSVRRSGSISRPQSRASTKSGLEPDYSDVEDDSSTLLAQSKEMGTSDHQLALQLELARQNSLAQYGKPPGPMQMDAPVEATIYEGSSFTYFHIKLLLLT